jgi:hypothetical protein
LAAFSQYSPTLVVTLLHRGWLQLQFQQSAGTLKVSLSLISAGLAAVLCQGRMAHRQNLHVSHLRYLFSSEQIAAHFRQGYNGQSFNCSGFHFK